MLTLTIVLACIAFALALVTFDHLWTTPRPTGKHVTDARRRATGRDLAYQTLRVGFRVLTGQAGKKIPTRSAHASHTSRRFEARAWAEFYATCA